MEEVTKEEFDIAMACLVDSGEVLAACPKCTLALSIKEYNTRKCKKCGKYDFDYIRFYPNGNKC